MTTKTLKLEIRYSKDNKIDSKTFFTELRKIQHDTFIACNNAMVYLHTNTMQDIIQKDIGIPKQQDKDLYSKSFGAYIEQKMKEIMITSNTCNVAQQRQFVENKYKNDKLELLKGRRKLTTFRNTLPIIIHNKNYKIDYNSKGFEIDMSLFNLTKLKDLGLKRGEQAKFNIIKPDNSKKAILTNILIKTYKQGSAQIIYDKRKSKWFVAISYSFEKKQDATLNKDLTMGIDLGIVNVATISIYDDNKETYIKIPYNERIINGRELINFRQRTESRRRELSIATKWASDNRIGHGYKKRMESVLKINDKISRFRETYNNKVSRYIVDMAFKYHVKTIQMENLSNFGDKKKESFLKNWSYYDLQHKIEYKAEEKGITVNKINPRYTSKRCSVCGNIHNDNRDCKNNQAKFVCKDCSNSDNADINASKNIAIPYIDRIIDEYVKGRPERFPKKKNGESYYEETDNEDNEEEV